MYLVLDFATGESYSGPDFAKNENCLDWVVSESHSGLDSIANENCFVLDSASNGDYSVSDSAKDAEQPSWERNWVVVAVRDAEWFAESVVAEPLYELILPVPRR